MAKVTDLNRIHEQIVEILNNNTWFILDYCDIDKAAIIIQNIYVTNDLMKGYGQDLNGGLSIISSKYLISVIYQNCASSYKSHFPLCNYDYLYDDIEFILEVMNAAIIRMRENM